MKETQHKRCGAKTRGDGHPCQRWAMLNGRCNLHGGKSLGGIASPTFKHGRHSKYLPIRLMDKYEAALGDPEWISLRHELALVDARLSELLEKIDTGESGALVRSLKERMDDFDRANRHAQNIKDEARRKEKLEEAAQALSDVRAMIYRGAQDWQIWADIAEMIDQRRKLSESERKRLVDMEQIITARDALALFNSLSLSVRKHVKEQDVLAGIFRDFSDAVGQYGLASLPDRGNGHYSTDPD